MQLYLCPLLKMAPSLAAKELAEIKPEIAAEIIAKIDLSDEDSKAWLVNVFKNILGRKVISILKAMSAKNLKYFAKEVLDTEKDVVKLEDITLRLFCEKFGRPVHKILIWLKSVGLVGDKSFSELLTVLHNDLFLTEKKALQLANSYENTVARTTQQDTGVRDDAIFLCEVLQVLQALKDDVNYTKKVCEKISNISVVDQRKSVASIFSSRENSPERRNYAAMIATAIMLTENGPEQIVQILKTVSPGVSAEEMAYVAKDIKFLDNDKQQYVAEFLQHAGVSAEDRGSSLKSVFPEMTVKQMIEAMIPLVPEKMDKINYEKVGKTIIHVFPNINVKQIEGCFPKWIVEHRHKAQIFKGARFEPKDMAQVLKKLYDLEPLGFVDIMEGIGVTDTNEHIALMRIAGFELAQIGKYLAKKTPPNSDERVKLHYILQSLSSVNVGENGAFLYEEKGQALKGAYPGITIDQAVDAIDKAGITEIKDKLRILQGAGFDLNVAAKVMDVHSNDAADVENHELYPQIVASWLAVTRYEPADVGIYLKNKFQIKNPEDLADIMKKAGFNAEAIGFALIAAFDELKTLLPKKGSGNDEIASKKADLAKKIPSLICELKNRGFCIEEIAIILTKCFRCMGRDVVLFLLSAGFELTAMEGQVDNGILEISTAIISTLAILKGVEAYNRDKAKAKSDQINLADKIIKIKFLARKTQELSIVRRNQVHNATTNNYVGGYSVIRLDKTRAELTLKDFEKNKCDVIIASDGKCCYVNQLPLEAMSRLRFDMLEESQKTRGMIVHDDKGRFFKYNGENNFDEMELQDNDYVQRLKRLIPGRNNSPLRLDIASLLGDAAIYELYSSVNTATTMDFKKASVEDIKKYLESCDFSHYGLRPAVQVIKDSEGAVVGYMTRQDSKKQFFRVSNSVPTIRGNGASREITGVSIDPDYENWGKEIDLHVGDGSRTSQVTEPKTWRHRNKTEFERLITDQDDRQRILEEARKAPNANGTITLTTRYNELDEENLGDNQNPDLMRAIAGLQSFLPAIRTGHDTVVVRKVKALSNPQCKYTFNVEDFIILCKDSDTAYLRDGFCHCDIKDGNMGVSSTNEDPLKVQLHLFDLGFAVTQKAFDAGALTARATPKYVQPMLYQILINKGAGDLNPLYLRQLARAVDLSGILITMLSLYVKSKNGKPISSNPTSEWWKYVQGIDGKNPKDYLKDFINENVSEQHKDFVRKFLLCNDEYDMRELLKIVDGRDGNGTTDFLKFADLFDPLLKHK